MTTTLTVGRTLLAAFAIVAGAVASVIAQQPEAGISPPSASVERIRAALQAQQPITRDDAGLFAPTQQPITRDGAGLFAPTQPDGVSLERLLEHPVIFRLGVLTFVTPSAGLFIDIRVPIGDLVTHAARSVAVAQHRRAESSAHAEVVKALVEFPKAQPK
jgi:hypothetical protein